MEGDRQQVPGKGDLRMEGYIGKSQSNLALAIFHPFQMEFEVGGSV